MRVLGTSACFLLAMCGWAAAEEVQWTNAVGVSVSGNTLTKTAGQGWGNAGGASVQVIRDGYGFVDFTATAANTDSMCGLSDGFQQVGTPPA